MVGLPHSWLASETMSGSPGGTSYCVLIVVPPLEDALFFLSHDAVGPVSNRRMGAAIDGV